MSRPRSINSLHFKPYSSLGGTFQAKAKWGKDPGLLIFFTVSSKIKSVRMELVDFLDIILSLATIGYTARFFYVRSQTIYRRGLQWQSGTRGVGVYFAASEKQQRTCPIRWTTGNNEQSNGNDCRD